MRPTTIGAALAALLLAACASAGSSGVDAQAAQEYLDEGRAQAGRGNHAAAIDLYSDALDENPEYPTAYYERAYSRIQLRLKPDDPTPGRELEELAIRDYSMAIRYNPAYGNAYYNRAMLYNSRARYKDAARDLMNAIRFNPDDPEAHLVLGRLYEEKFEGRRVEALQHYERYVDLGGQDEKIRETVALWKQLKNQAVEPAVAAAAGQPKPEDEETAKELHQKFAQLMKDGDRDEALKSLQELLGKYGNTQYVRKQERYFKAILRAFEK